MTNFLVERYLPSTALAEIEAALGRLVSAQDPERTEAWHLWTALIEAEETCLSLFEARSAGAVEAANRAARFPFDRVVEAAIIAEPASPPGSPRRSRPDRTRPDRGGRPGR